MNLEELLLTVQKPGRYVGGEWNSVKKVWADDKVKVLLAFPDIYEIGMSYLGIKILYGILNNRDDCLCERVFSPWRDFEEVLRKNSISIYSLESRRAIKEFDIIGFSLAHELTFTNVLNILDLGNIPVHSSDRSDEDPIVIAGGPSCYNPEPMAEFVDAFLIGDGEEAIGEIVDAYKSVHSPQSTVHGPSTIGHGQTNRKELLKKLAAIEGVYVPSLYQEGKTIIKKRVVKDLNNAFYPTKQIVPNIQIIHDRLVIEIMRGCKHACAFCQASPTYRPCRERRRSRIVEIAREGYKMTGYDEISLLSLSSGDHSELKEIIEDLNKEFRGKAVSISVPSLRIEDILKDLPALISEVRKSGLTFAPEAGSDGLRKILNKDIDIDKLFQAASESFKKGWRRVKLYFMIGLPGEKGSDISDIAALVQHISNLKREFDGRSAQVTASINAFVPKPHTPFERLAMDEIETLERKRRLLIDSAKSRSIELDFHSFWMSYIEALLSRGDRNVSKVIFEAWKSGARFDSWQDMFQFHAWKTSFEKTGCNPAHYITRPIPSEEVLPWGFIKA